MRSKPRESLSQGQVHGSETRPAHEAVGPERDTTIRAEVTLQPLAEGESLARVTDSVGLAARPPQPWMQAVDAVLGWYGAMFRLTFGLGRVSRGEPGRSITVSSAAPTSLPGSRAVAPLESSSVASLEAPSTAVLESSSSARSESPSTAPLQSRPNRRALRSVANTRVRSRTTSGTKRRRRAA